MDLSSRTAQLCIEGTRAEFERRLEEARELFRQAWEAAGDDGDAAMAAHYVGHLEDDPHRALHWHLVALVLAARDPRTDPFRGSLLVSLGGAYEALGLEQDARRYFDQAAALGVHHQPARSGR